MNLPWRSHIIITPEQAQQYIEEQIADLSITSIEKFGEGWDNIAFLVNNHLVFRFAKTNETANLLQQENKILPKIQQFLSLSIPNPIITGKPTIRNPYYFHAYEKLLGIAAYQVELSNNDMIFITKQLAIFLKHLHNIDENYYTKIGAKPVVYDRADIKVVSDGLTKRMHLVNDIHTLDMKYITQYIKQIEKT